MTTVVLPADARGTAPALQRPACAVTQSIWQAPLVPLTLAATAGVVLDRHLTIPLLFEVVTAIAALVAWFSCRQHPRRQLPLIYLAMAAAALAAAYHRTEWDIYPTDDIGNYATTEPRPAHLRGVLDEEPAIVLQPSEDPLKSIPSPDGVLSVLRVTQLKTEDDWIRVSGRARLQLGAVVTDLHVGDQVEVVGRLVAPSGPQNPGGFDFASYLRDQRIRALIQVRKTPDGVLRLAEGWFWTMQGWLARIRGWGQRTLTQALPHETSGVAAALLLGEGSGMTGQDWEKYIRTGVIHVLAISGQHLVILAIFLWWLLRLFGIRQRHGACLVAAFLLGYALLAGGRPPVMRSAVMVCAGCGALLLRRQVLIANLFALSWLIVLLLNPTDVFTSGCQLSFLAVAVLYWGARRWFRFDPDPLAQLVEESRPAWERLLRQGIKGVVLGYGVTLAIWLAAAPLVGFHYHLLSPIGILAGPPTVWLTSVALLAGFLLLLATLVCWPLVPVLAWVTHASLAGCNGLIRFCVDLPGAYWYLGDIPAWWLWGFYLPLLTLLFLETLHRYRRGVVTASAAWLCLGLVVSADWPTGELRCTFLAVGHGGCTVLETPDGRTLLYDAGALGGPDVARRHIAPFLWSRGIRRLDEVFLSHADLDHFNGLPALLERFAVGQISCTPSFADKALPGVRLTLAEIEKRRIPTRILHAGDRLSAGAINFLVLHPPAHGPEGNENARSLVLLVQYAGHNLLLTGDLEGPGLAQVLALPATAVDVLMAPHHGSRTANTPSLAGWASPKVVVSCQGPPRRPSRSLDPYTIRGSIYLGTWPHGAITMHSSPGKIIIETFTTHQQITLDPGPNP